MTPDKFIATEKFPVDDLVGLRRELLGSHLDSWQAADLISSYLSGRGYGVSSKDARTTASRLESSGYSVESMQEELGRIALVM